MNNFLFFIRISFRFVSFNKASRIEEVQGIRSKFPNKVPVIVERFHKERSLPQLDKTKFLVPQELTMSQFVTIIRNRMAISATQTFFLLIEDKGNQKLSGNNLNQFIYLFVI